MLLSLCLAGCGTSAPAVDGGSTPDARPGGGEDAGELADTASITVSGARSASLSYDGDANYVSCLADASGFLSITARSSAGSREGLSFSFQDYDGPGLYELTYSPRGGGPSATLELPGGYQYWFFMDTSTVDFSTIESTCTLDVTGVEGTEDRLDGTLTCSQLPANITSPDYDDRDAAGLRPSVGFTARISCAL